MERCFKSAVWHAHVGTVPIREECLLGSAAAPELVSTGWGECFSFLLITFWWLFKLLDSASDGSSLKEKHVPMDHLMRRTHKYGWNVKDKLQLSQVYSHFSWPHCDGLLVTPAVSLPCGVHAPPCVPPTPPTPPPATVLFPCVMNKQCSNCMWAGCVGKYWNKALIGSTLLYLL